MVEFFDGTPNIIIVPPFLVDFIASSNAFMLPVATMIHQLRAHHVACGQCHLCKSGSETLCEHYSKSNLQPCGLAEEYVVPEWNIKGVLKLPESVGFDDAAMIEPLACCVRAWARIDAKPGNFIAIYGAGPTGLLHAMLAKHYRMGDIACIDPNKFRTDFAAKTQHCKRILGYGFGT